MFVLSISDFKKNKYVNSKIFIVYAFFGYKNYIYQKVCKLSRSLSIATRQSTQRLVA